MLALMQDFYAASSRASRVSKLRTVRRLLAAWGDSVLPITCAKVLHLCAALKAGGYRSAESYVSFYRCLAERAGCQLGPDARRAVLDGLRSCRRGIGPPVRAMALPFVRLHELPADRDPWCPGGPLCPRNVIVGGAWFMTREIELSTARASLVRIRTQPELVVEWHLPASKTDPMAFGMSRSHGCACGAGPPRASCPVHALWDQLTFLHARFPERWVGCAPEPQLPLFPDQRGRVVEKSAMVLTIRKAATLLQSPLCSVDCLEQVNGHSLRPTGAQGLSRLGLDLWSIQLLGRWGSTAVRDYVREAALQGASAWARRAAISPGTEDILAAVTRLAAGAPEPPSREAISAIVLETLADLGITERQELTGPLTDEAAAEVALVCEAPAGAVVSEGITPHPQLVTNTASGVQHRILVGPPVLPSTQWHTVCGWRFGALDHASHSQESRSRCEKCFR